MDQIASLAGRCVRLIGTAKCGKEEGSSMVGQSVIVAPSGEIVAMAATLEDEVITASCDLDMGKRYRQTIFDFARHREPEAYRLIVERKSAVPPPETCPGGNPARRRAGPSPVRVGRR
jgi:hypothetical protein